MKKKKFWVSIATVVVTVVLVKTFPFMYHIIYYYRTDIDEDRVISFLRVQMDMISESS